MVRFALCHSRHRGETVVKRGWEKRGRGIMRENGAVAFTSGVLRVKIRLQTGPVMRAFDDDDDALRGEALRVRIVHPAPHRGCCVDVCRGDTITASKRPISDCPASFRHNDPAARSYHLSYYPLINIKRVPRRFLHPP